MNYEQQPDRSRGVPSPEEELPRPQIWVGSVADDLAGKMHGRWLDAARLPYEVYADIQQILDSSPTPGATEWAIYDWEGFGDFDITPTEAIGRVCDLARSIVQQPTASAQEGPSKSSSTATEEKIRSSILG